MRDDLKRCNDIDGKGIVVLELKSNTASMQW